MIDSVGGFVVLAVFITLAIIASLLNRKQDRQETPPPFRPHGQPPPPPARSWEEELRRALEGSLPPTVIVPPPPPPLVTHRAPPPIQVHEQASEESGIEVSLSMPERNIEPPFRPLPGLSESQEQYVGASRLQQRVAKHMADVTRHRVGTTVAHHSEVPAETLAVARSLRTHHGARAAIIASILFGPPVALEK